MKAFLRCFYSKLDVRLGMGNGNEGCFELRRREKDAAFEHVAEILRVAFDVGFLGIGIVVNGRLREEQRGQRPDGVDVAGDFFRAKCFAN